VAAGHAPEIAEHLPLVALEEAIELFGWSERASGIRRLTEQQVAA
jgi:hypothetical protein